MLRIASAFSFLTCLFALSLSTPGPASANGYYYGGGYPRVVYPGPAYSYPARTTYYSYRPAYPKYNRPAYYGGGYKGGYAPKYRTYGKPYGYGYKRANYGYRNYGYPKYRYGYRPYPRAAYGGALLQTGYAKCGRVAYVPYGYTWYRGRDYRC